MSSTLHLLLQLVDQPRLTRSNICVFFVGTMISLLIPMSVFFSSFVYSSMVYTSSHHELPTAWVHRHSLCPRLRRYWWKLDHITPIYVLLMTFPWSFSSRHVKAVGECTWDYDNAFGDGMNSNLSRLDILSDKRGQEHMEFEMADCTSWMITLLGNPPSLIQWTETQNVEMSHIMAHGESHK